MVVALRRICVARFHHAEFRGLSEPFLVSHNFELVLTSQGRTNRLRQELIVYVVALHKERWG